MDLARIRGESVRTARHFVVDIPPKLPLLDRGIEMRRVDETISRILAMHAAAATAYGFDRAKAIAWLKQEAVTDSLSDQESRFIFGGVGQRHRFQVQIEGMWALAWAMEIASEMDFGKECDSHFAMMLPNLKQGQSSSDIRRRARFRPLEQVVAACDLAYCLHWAIRQSEVSGRQAPRRLKSYVVVERRRALEWLLGREKWDEVPLDT